MDKEFQTVRLVRVSRKQQIADIKEELSQLPWYRFARRAWLKKLLYVCELTPTTNKRNEE